MIQYQGYYINKLYTLCDHWLTRVTNNTTCTLCSIVMVHCSCVMTVNGAFRV